MKTFWQIIDEQLDTIERDRINTYEGIKTIMPTTPGESAAPAFFGGSGGDRSLFESLSIAGWVQTWSEASYYYVATHPDTGDTLTYIEGDIYPGDIHA
ncbi:MAG: hypothetical protein WBA46_01790 [Thermomicrobiales bacterium]